ncbi:MAG TPA: CAP domain-containing protein [Paenisporosarcina sp.]|nr:CAP domain-containing protein [Paenisporosarcina sp.]
MKKMLLGLTMGAMVFSVGQATTAEASFSSPTFQTQDITYLSTGTKVKQVDFSTIEKQMLEKLYAHLAAAGFTPAQIEQVVQKQAEGTKPVETQPVAQKPAETTKPVAAQPVAPKPVEPAKPEATQPAKPAPAAPAKQPAASAPATQAQGSISNIEQQVLTLTNQERAKGGLKALATDSALMDSARAKSADMSKNNYFSHTSPTLGSPFDQMKARGIQYKAAAENIAMGQQTAAEVVKGWMESPGHRANIMNGTYTHIGIGYDANGNYWTQQFIQK